MGSLPRPRPNINAALAIFMITVAWQIQCTPAIIPGTTRYGQLPTDGIYGTDLPASTIQWTGGSFEFPCPSTKSLFKSSGKYISKNVIATRAQIASNTVFLALPRFRPGIPSTLVKTQIKNGACVTTFTPFPCWSMQEEGNCKALQSVVDIYIDQNDVLWALDTGIVNTLETSVRKCPPKIVAINIKNGKVLKTIELDSLTSSNSRLQYLAVDYSLQGQCFVYVADAANRAIIVYNIQQNKGYRVVLPKAVSQGCRGRDVLYIALVRKDCGSTVLYLTYLSSKKIFIIPTEYLRSGVIDGRVSGKIFFGMSVVGISIYLFSLFCLQKSERNLIDSSSLAQTTELLYSLGMRVNRKCTDGILPKRLVNPISLLCIEVPRANWLLTYFLITNGTQ